MVVFPHAKINLGLQVIEKRRDGFHNLISCFYPIAWSDLLEVQPAKKFTFTTTGIDIPGTPDENLCVKAYRLLRQEFNLAPVHIHLHKIIPIGAGLGGGSSDASYTLMALRDLFDLPLENHKLDFYANQLGSDCPFFLTRHPAMIAGKGDQISPVSLSLPASTLVVIYPGLHVATKEAYAQLTPKDPEYNLQEVLHNVPLTDWSTRIENDFESSVFTAFPEIKKLKEALYAAGALYASMSGSGAAVFGFFSVPPDLSNIPDHYTVWHQAI